MSKPKGMTGKSLTIVCASPVQLFIHTTTTMRKSNGRDCRNGIHTPWFACGSGSESTIQKIIEIPEKVYRKETCREFLVFFFFFNRTGKTDTLSSVIVIYFFCDIIFNSLHKGGGISCLKWMNVIQACIVHDFGDAIALSTIHVCV